jgi:hypothetical protein
VSKGGVVDGPTIVILKNDGRPICLFFKDNVPMLADSKAFAPTDNGTGGNDGGGDDVDDVAPLGSSGCFVATAAFGSLAAQSVQALTSARDTAVATSSVGSSLVSLYYELSPMPARKLRNSEALRSIVRSLLQ